MTEYGRIHTDGSRSGGQPLLLPCPFCGEQCAMLLINQGDKWAHYEPTCLEVRTGYNLSNDAPWRDEAIAAWNTRQPTQSDALKAENERLREHLISALDTLKDTAVCDDKCAACNEAYAALQEQSK